MEDEILEFKYGDRVIVYGREGIKASQVANCYGISGYPYLTLVNPGEKDKLKFMDLSQCIKLFVRTEYPAKVKVTSTNYQPS